MASEKPMYLASVGRLLGFASAGTTRASDRLLREYDLTVQQWIPLSALWRTNPLVESELASYCHMSASSLNRLLDRMEKKKLVARAKDESDKRRTLVSLGTQGKKLSHLLSFHEEINKLIFVGMNSTEQKQFVGLLERVIENLQTIED